LCFKPPPFSQLIVVFLCFLLLLFATPPSRLSDGTGHRVLYILFYNNNVKYFCSGRIGSAIFGLSLENFPLKSQIFNFFHFGSRKISSGLVKKYLSQIRVSLLFTEGQKNAWVGFEFPTINIDTNLIIRTSRLSKSLIFFNVLNTALLQRNS